MIRIRPQTSAGEDVSPLIEDPWKTLDCEEDPNGCVVSFDDPEFTSSGRDAAYYVRAIEEPTMVLNGKPLETKFDENGQAISTRPCLQSDNDKGGCPASSEERAWSSPIYVDQP